MIHTNRCNEEWRPVFGYVGFYEVSNWGRVRSLSREVNMVYSARRSIKGQILSQCLTVEGYPYVRLSKLGVVKNGFVHRIVALAFIPNPEGKPQVNHKNGIRHDTYFENLEWCTQSENITHSYKCLLRRGPKNSKTKHHILNQIEKEK